MAAAARLLSSPPPPGGISKVKTARCKIHPRPFPPTLRHHRHHHRPTTLRRATQNPRGSHALHRDYSRPRRDTASKQAGEGRGNNRICPTYHQFLPAQFLPPIFPRKGIRSAALAIESREGLRGKWTGSEGKGREEAGYIREFSRDSGSTREAKPLDPIRLSSPSRLIVCNGLCSAPSNSSTLEN